MLKEVKELQHQLLVNKYITDEIRSKMYKLMSNDEINWYPEVIDMHKQFLFKYYEALFSKEHLEIIYKELEGAE